MFTNPDTLWIEIIVVVLVLAFFGFLLGRYIYKKRHGMPTGECSCCASKKNKLIKDYHKKYSSN